MTYAAGALLWLRLARMASAVLLSDSEKKQPFALRVRLTTLLYSRMSNIVAVGLAGLLSGIYAYVRDDETFVLALAAVGFSFVMLRCGGIKLFQSRLAKGLRFDPESWIVFYGLTACCSSICWGVVSFSCLAFSHDPVLYLVSVVCNTATAGALAARNAGTPRIAQLQLLTSLVPVMAGAVFADDTGYYFLVLAVPALIFGLIVVVAELNKQLIELYSSQIKLVSLSNTDYLTQIPNRRHFGESCNDVLGPFAILMIDVDYFKGFNDFYGHPAGDRCLQRIAQLLQSCLRASDSVVSRYGGEEFAVLLRETGPVAAAATAQRLCNAIKDDAIPHANRKDGLDRVTISVGVAAAETLEITCDGTIRSADEALYQAKTQGRNRISIATAA